uniref:Uncharacterized protein n=1 Tax=Rhizophora mucronata TaxID=61149 RepID=A0A2P2KPM3_RHIMU
MYPAYQSNPSHLTSSIGSVVQATMPGSSKKFIGVFYKVDDVYDANPQNTSCPCLKGSSAHHSLGNGKITCIEKG